MLFKLSLKNIKKSIKDYAIYFFTLVLGIAIFYVFNSLDSSTAMLTMTKRQSDIIELINSMLGVISVFVCVILGFLIIYASQFLMKRRKKEFGIYMMLGMGKKELSKILVLEALLIGLFSLVVGLILGVFASQFMSLLVANLFEADMSNYVFSFSLSALSKTILFFTMIYLFVMLFNTFSISKCKLIDLINAAKQNEKISNKNAWISVLAFILSVIMLSYAYYQVTTQGLGIDIDFLGYMIILGCLGSFLFFWSVSGLLLKIVQSNKRLYLKNLNMFVVRQLNSKINTTVISMSIISIMLFMTICILSSGLSFNESLRRNLKEMTPVDLNVEQFVNLDSPMHSYNDNDHQIEYSEDVISLSKQSLKQNLELMGIDVDKQFKDVFEYQRYMSPQVIMRNLLPEDVLEEYPNLMIDMPEKLMKISDYNTIAKLYGNKQFSLAEDEYIVICNFESMLKLRNEGLKQQPQLIINDRTLKPKYSECQNGYTEIATNHTNNGIILLPDDILNEGMAVKTLLVANYNAKNQDDHDKIEQIIMNGTGLNQDIVDKLSMIHLRGVSKQDLYQASVGLGAVGTFVGIYIGIVFLISSAAILALKELSDSSDNKERYVVLRKLGVDEHMISKALFIQIGVFFLLPVVLASIHSIFGIHFCVDILSTMGTEGLMPSILMTALFIIFIYGGYFLITYFCSRNIIRERS